MQKKYAPWDFKTPILEKIEKKGGWVNCHAHIDRSYTVNKKLYKLANAYRHEKWKLNANLRKTSTVSQIYDRMAMAIECMINQSVSAIGTFIDVDYDVKDKAIKAAEKVREKYKSAITIKYINCSSYGIMDKQAREWFDVGADFVDIVGGLLKADAGREPEHLDILLRTAKEKKKMLHVHVDELNDPDEFETELLAQKTLEHRMEGKVVGIHGISINAHPKEYRQKLYKLMKKADLMMISCPISWLNSRRNETLTPTHNPVTPVDELTREGITVGIGTDNIADLFMPYNDAEMWNDLRVLMETNRLYNADNLVDIATANGRKILGLH